LIVAFFAVNYASFLVFCKKLMHAYNYSTVSVGVGTTAWATVFALSIIALCECRKRIKLE